MYSRILWFLPPSLLMLGASYFVVREGHSELKTKGLNLLWKGRPFTGLVLGFHANLRPSLLATYVGGQHHGWEFRWHSNGHKSLEKNYRQGLYEGVSQTWHENGRIKTWRNYSEGLADGEQWAWGPDGQVLEYNFYRDDQEIAHKTWTFDGKPYHNYVYQNGEKVGLEGEPFCKRRTQF